MFVGVLVRNLTYNSRVSRIFRNQFARGQKTIGSTLIVSTKLSYRLLYNILLAHSSIRYPVCQDGIRFSLGVHCIKRVVNKLIDIKKNY